MLFEEWVEMWLDVYKKPFVKESTYTMIKYLLNHIMPAFSGKKLSEIRGMDIQRFLNGLSETPNTCEKCRKYLHDIFEYAYRNRYIDFNPILAVKMKPHQPEKTNPMNVEERRRFIESIRRTKYELLYLTYLYTGCRLSEVIRPGGLEIDFKNKLIYIHGTKTERSERVMPLFDKLAEALKTVPDYKAYYTSWKRNYVYLYFKRHMRRLHMQGFCVRSLRCTFSQMCYELGVRETTIQAWLGHTTTKTTKRFYIDKGMISTSPTDNISEEVNVVNRSL